MVKGLATGNRARAYVVLETAGCTTASCGCSRLAHERDGYHTHGLVVWSEIGAVSMARYLGGGYVEVLQVSGDDVKRCLVGWFSIGLPFEMLASTTVVVKHGSPSAPPLCQSSAVAWEGH